MADSQVKIRELQKKVARLEKEARKAREAESRLIKKEEEFQVFRKMLINLSRNIIFLRSLIDMPELYLDGQWRIVGCSGNFIRLSPKAAEFARKKKHLREFLREGDFKKIEKYIDRVEALRTLPFEEGNTWRLRYKGPNGRDRIGKTWTGFANSAGGHNWSIVSENGKRRFRHAPHIEDNMDCYLVSAREYGGPDEDLKISCKFRTSANPGFIRDLSVVLSAASGLEETLPDLVGYTVCTGARDNTEASIQRQQHGLITIVESLEPDTEYRVTVERTGGRIRRSVENLSSGVPLAELEIVDPNAIYDRLNHVGFTTFSGELEVEDIEIYTRKTRFPIEQFKIPFEVETEIRYPKLEGRFYRLRLGMGQSNGRVLNTLLFEDVTEARIAEEHLKRSEKYIRTLVEKAYELIVILEPHGRIHYISPSVENVLGFDSAEVAGRMIFDFIHREDLPRANEIFAALVAEAGGSVSASFRIIDKAGNWRNLEGTGRNLIAEPSIRGIVINAHDITENLKAERALREAREQLEQRVGERTAELALRNEELKLESLERMRAVQALRAGEQKYKAITENTNDVAYTVDAEGKITYVSPQIERYGYTPAEIISHSFIDFILPEDREPALADFQITAQTGAEFPTQFRILDPSGNVHWVEEYGRVLRDDSGNFAGLTGLLRDITERKKVEAELRKHREHLEDLVRERTQEFTKSNRQLEEEIVNRKETEKALREREEWFRLVFDGSRDAIFITGEDSGFVEVNEAAVTLTGYSKPELLKMKITDLHDELDQGAYYKYFGRIMAGENIISESKIRRKDGSKVFTEFSNRRIIIRGVPYMHTIARDVADRKEADQALHESGERYRLLIENAGHPIYMIDFEGTILMLNNLAAGYLEMSPEQVTGRSIWELFHPRLASRHLKDVFQALSGAGGVDVEYQVRLQGKKMWFKVNIQPYGKVDGRAVAQVIAQDITELKQAQGQLRKERDSLEIRLSEGTAALRHSELRLQESLKELTCLFSIRQEFDQEQSIETTLTSCAAHIRKTLHQPENKIVGINLDGVQMTTEGWDYLTENYVESLLQIGGVKRGFLRVKALRPHVELLPFEQDLIRHAGAALSDFIHNRELRAQLIQTEKMAAAGRLAAGVAHEINNPLGAIKNSLYIIKRSIPGNHPDYAYFELMNSEIDRVAGIIAQLYNLYKPSSQEVQAVDLQVIVGNVLKMLESQVRRRKIVVQNEIEGSGFSPRLSVNQITQVLYNLILNAVQAMPQGGRLTLGLTKAGGSHELWISDTGPGIPDEVLPHIFEPFFTTKTKGGNPSEGMGIGLSLSRSFMEALGGKITVNTKVGWGTTFSLIFPAKIARGETKPPDAS